MELYDELVARGLIAQVTDEKEIRELINAGKAVFYIGFDPTADSLHVGHFMALCLMKRLQMGGNKPIALLGGGTGMIGDPSGKTDMRKMLTKEDINHNIECFKKQMSRFIEFGEDKAIMVNNGDWLLDLNYIDLLREVEDLKIDSDHMMIVSPDEGGTNRAVYLANVLGLDMGMFYKRRDYSKIVDGRNPIVAHEFLGSSVEGKDVVIVDDMISSGESMIDVATELKKRKANRVFVVATFGLFTNGLEPFDKAVADGTIYKVVTTNLIYQTPELLSRPYYINCDMSKYIAYIIDTLNHDSSISDLLNPYDRITRLVSRYNEEQKGQ